MKRFLRGVLQLAIMLSICWVFFKSADAVVNFFVVCVVCLFIMALLGGRKENS